jgi:hypothetical protein
MVTDIFKVKNYTVKIFNFLQDQLIYFEKISETGTHFGKF